MQKDMKRYDIYLVKLDPTEGAEMTKTRPVVIVSLDALNKNLQTVVVCPITSQVCPTWRTRLQIKCNGRVADIAVDQIRVVSKQRLIQRMGSLSQMEASILRHLITEMYGE